MAKLYYRYGTVSSAKTLNLLAVAHNYRHQGKKVILMRPEMDKRFGEANIMSRAGLEKPADLLVEPETNLLDQEYEDVSCILVDEVNFLQPHHIEELRRVTVEKNIPVICYGLRTDSKSRLFEPVVRLLELCDTIEEVKTTCSYCNRKATMSLRFIDGIPSTGGAIVDLGSDEKYSAACYKCYADKLEEGRKMMKERELAGAGA